MKKAVISLILVALALSYCQKNIGGPTESDINDMLLLGLSKVDDASQIEQFLDSNGFSFVFDDTFNRYQVVRREFDESCFRTVLYDCGIQIFINLDDSGRYDNHEVLLLYGGL